MTSDRWLQIVSILLRYAAPVAVGWLTKYLTEDDRQKLLQVLTSPEVIAAGAASAISAALAIRHWLQVTRTSLTAAAMGPGSLADAREISKTQSPSLATPTTSTPTLTRPVPGFRA